MGDPIRPPALILERSESDPLSAGIFQAADGVDLPLALWRPLHGVDPRAVIVGVHGVNDYARFLHRAGPWLADRGIVTVAFDQRGFGRSTTQKGIWPGTQTMVADLAAVAQAAAAEWPDTPLFVLGESMGGAVVLSALHRGLVEEGIGDAPALDPAGVILISPAIWARETMPFYQRWALWLAANISPGLELSPDGLDIWPTDNLPMLIEHSEDPNVIRGNRIDLLAGLVDLMDEAYASGPATLAPGHPGPPVLMTYGDQEQVIYPEPLIRFFERLAESGALPEEAALAGQAGEGDRVPVVTAAEGQVGRVVFAFYPDSYHMMLRDTVAETVLQDIEAFIADPSRRDLPSGNAYRPRGPALENPPLPVREARDAAS